MKKSGMIGFFAAMLGGLSASASMAQKGVFNYNSAYRPKIKQSSQKGWRPSAPSEYFGRRSTIVTAFSSEGIKRMKLKNALKHNYQFT